MSAQKRKPGKKTGARINNILAIKPLGVKSSIKYELSARAALIALENDTATQDHLVSLYVLAELAERISGELYVKQHAAAIKRLCNQINENAYHCSFMVCASMSVSVDVLLCWLLTQKNIDIARHAHRAIQEFTA